MATSKKRSREHEIADDGDDTEDSEARFKATSKSAKRPRTVKEYDYRMKNFLKWTEINCVDAVDPNKPRGVDITKVSVDKLQAFFGHISVWHEGERLKKETKVFIVVRKFRIRCSNIS